MNKLNIKIKTSVVLLFSSIILTIVTIMMLFQYKASHELAIITTQKVFDKISNNVINKIKTYDNESKQFIDLLKQINDIDQIPKLSTKHLIFPVMTEYIKNSNYVYATYIGYKNNSFYEIINLNLSKSIKKNLKVPSNARWLIIKHIKTNSEMIRYEEVLDKNLNKLTFKEKRTSYKTSQRPWYKKAIETNTAIKTDPYFFSTLKEYGVTYARAINKTKGTVLGLDISLKSFNQLLEDKDLVKGSASFIFRGNGEVLAQYNGISNKLITNLNKNYSDIFITNKQVLDLNKHVLKKINGIEYIKYTTLLKSDFGGKDYLTILSPNDKIMEPYIEKIYEALIITAIVLFIFVFPIVFYSIDLIVKPILALEKEHLKISNGKFNDVKIVPSFMIEISSLSDSLVKMSDSLEDLTHNLENKIKARTKEVEEKNKNIATLLNNAGQGFLYFDRNMIIGKEISKEALRIFNKDIVGENIIKLLFPADEESLITSTMLYILDEEEERSGILISLLKKEFLINDQFIEFEYKILNKNTFMLILTDITDKKDLDQQIKDEQQILKMVVETVRSIEQFKELKNDYESMISNIENLKSLDKLSSLRMEIHTFKGLFAQKDMLNIVKELHDFESLIDKSLKEEKISEGISTITKETMQLWLDKDIKILKDILGNDYFNSENRITIKKARISKLAEDILILKDKVKNYTEKNSFDIKIKSSFESLILGINNLKNRNIYVYINPYKSLVDDLSMQLEKPLNELIINQDEDIYLDDSYKGFLTSLVHIFRNSIDHGIETIEKREELGKELCGTICLDIFTKENYLHINISDDGKGIYLNTIKNLAIQKNLYTKDEVNKLSEQEILLIIFKDSFSTSSNITDISGRGVGLASILNELNKLNGSLYIENEFGKGIKFMFTLPLKK